MVSCISSTTITAMAIPAPSANIYSQDNPGTETAAPGK